MDTKDTVLVMGSDIGEMTKIGTRLGEEFLVYVASSLAMAGEVVNTHAPRAVLYRLDPTLEDCPRALRLLREVVGENVEVVVLVPLITGEYFEAIRSVHAYEVLIEPCHSETMLTALRSAVAQSHKPGSVRSHNTLTLMLNLLGEEAHAPVAAAH